MEFPNQRNHHHRHHDQRDDEERQSYPPPGTTLSPFDQPPPPPRPYHYGEDQPPPPPKPYYYRDDQPPPPPRPYYYGEDQHPPPPPSCYREDQPPPNSYYEADRPPPIRVSHVSHSSHGYAPPSPPSQSQGLLHHQPPAPPVQNYDYPSSQATPSPRPVTVHHVAHQVHHESPAPQFGTETHHTSHLPSSSPHNSYLSNKPTFRIFSKADPNLSLSIREGKVILARYQPTDDFQRWYKDEKYSTQVKDEERFPSFALINKATGHALKHSIGATQPVQLRPYNPDVLDESMLWTESADLGDGFRTVRMVNNIHLNVDAFHGDKKSGGVHDGTTIVLWNKNKGDNQRWKIVPHFGLLLSWVGLEWGQYSGYIGVYVYGFQKEEGNKKEPSRENKKARSQLVNMLVERILLLFGFHIPMEAKDEMRISAF
ncbi:hypothetical protein ACFX2I_008334 [Malus domestica]